MTGLFVVVVEHGCLERSIYGSWAVPKHSKQLLRTTFNTSTAMAFKILVTGVTGGLGRSVLDTLLEHVPASSLAASSSNRSTAAILRNKGVEFRWVDYNVPESLQEAFKGVDKLFFVSTSEVNPEKRTKQHANVVEAAKAAGIKHVCPKYHSCYNVRRV